MALVLDTSHPEHNKRLGQEEREELDRRRKNDDEAKNDMGLAKYKIEVLFSKGFSTRNPSAGIISFFENGNHLHGGGDSILHICPGKHLGKNNCDSFIPDPSHGYGFLVCPKCQEVWDGDDVIGQFAARLPAQKWAELIHKFYLKLEMRCDIVIKYHSQDIRAAAHKEGDTSDALALARSDKRRLRRIYMMSDIIKDTSAGADLLGRIKAFVVA